MKKLILALLLVSVLPIMAFAQTEVDAWYLDGTNWVPIGLNNLQAPARCWASAFASGACNKTHWDIPVTIEADVAQWIEWQMSGTSWLWRVRKPGTYAADCITANIKSNQNVLIDYEGFDSLRYVGVGGKTSVNPVIPVWYAWSFSGSVVPGDADWVEATRLNIPAEWDTIFDSMDLHTGLQWKLWNKIKVVECNSACKYRDEAKITLELLCQKDWIDPATGYFKELGKP